VQKSLNEGYVPALINTGVKIETIQDLENVINEKTAMM
jgi:hypothetical protein